MHWGVGHIFSQQKNNFEQLKMNMASCLQKTLDTLQRLDCLMRQQQYFLQTQIFLSLLHFAQLHRQQRQQQYHFQ